MDLAARKYGIIQELTLIDENLLIKLEMIIKKHKVNQSTLNEKDKTELIQRVETYRENPNDLIDWDEVKNNW